MNILYFWHLRTFIDAVDVGYRHFDFAGLIIEKYKLKIDHLDFIFSEMYGNQKELGEGFIYY